jgi:UrcA family protein
MSLGAAASAAAADDTPTRTVKAWDLDLAQRDDVATLYERVQAAATDVCREEAGRYYRDTRMQAPAGWRERCVQEAVDSAVRDARSPSLAALHTQAPRVAARF